MGNSLEERLQEHSNSFNGLLSLIPAKYYYDEETSNQWQQKRKSKKEHQINKKQKLNPESNTDLSAREVLENAEKTAKPVVLPGEKYKQIQAAMEKARQDENDDVEVGSEELENDDEDEDEDDVEDNNSKDEDEEMTDNKEEKGDGIIQDKINIIFDDNGDEIVEGEFKKIEIQKQLKNGKGKKQLSKEEQEERERKHKELKSKLQAKIQSMREKRKAPGSKAPGAATSRQQILEERRRKAELKKEMKKKVIEDDESSDDDDDEDIVDGNDTAQSNEFGKVMFGNIEFLDGERVSSDLSSIRKLGKRKGPSNNDIKGHLKKLENEKLKLENLDTESKINYETKNKWKKAFANVEGVKVKDNEKLLKKALRRKESQKRKSEREWKDRIQNVKDEKKMKADRREENLRIRKANRGKDRKHQIKQLPSYKRSRAHKKLAGNPSKNGGAGASAGAGAGSSSGSNSKRAGFEGGIRSHRKRK